MDIILPVLDKKKLFWEYQSISNMAKENHDVLRLVYRDILTMLFNFQSFVFLGERKAEQAFQ